jgi:hypothetical protein
MYRLKKGQESFEVVDGPAAGMKFKRGREYDTIPTGEKHRFEIVKTATPKVPVKTNDPKPAKEKK